MDRGAWRAAARGVTQEASCLELGLCSSSGSQGPSEGTPTCARFALLLTRRSCVTRLRSSGREQVVVDPPKAER